ncbi:putative ribonuclease H-like domain-containing protein [Tanacetum coccineum]|uniref:Ribonuclease H-like domain-containing protein n=1 Tax=Tanacetum coccineum TaxID=301880 RepID=A0ABQ5CF03_9ASTR
MTPRAFLMKTGLKPLSTGRPEEPEEEELLMCDKKNNVLFTNTACFVLSPNFKLPDESQVLLKVPRKNNMYSVDMKNIVPKESLTCLVAKATLDESMLWHRRLGHINFKTINKLVKDNLVRGLPAKHLKNDQICVACLKGKQHKASCKSKIQNSITHPLFMLHMDLFGPNFVSSLMNKKYCLVVTDDHSRFTWVFFLASKDETSGILKNFITEIKNLVDKKVKIIRCDNGKYFKNRVMNELCEMKGIQREFSATYYIFAEAVNTACYVQNMVIIVKPHNKTPYELFRGRFPAFSFMRPFGCHVTILNTLDHLGKFDGKSDDGFFVGYSLTSKAFRVYNIRTRKVEENLHIRFLEDKPIVTGDGLKWQFDIDSLTKLINYVPVVAGINSNGFAGSEESKGACHTSNETESSQDYIVMPLWKDGLMFDSPSKNFSDDKPQPSSNAEKKDDEGVSKPSGFSDQEQLESSTPNINTVRSSINTASANFKTGSLNINTVSPTFITTRLNCSQNVSDMFSLGRSATLEATYADLFDKGNDKDTNEHGFISAVYEGKTHEDLHTCLIEAIRLFLAYASFMSFMVYQMDVKSAFLYGTIKEEVYVCQPLGFKDLDYPDKVYKMSSIGELNLFLGLQVKQREDGIFISQDKYVAEILRKFGFTDVRTASTPMDTEKPFLKDLDGDDVDVRLYRSMIGSLMYLTSSIPDIMFAVCACARFQVTPKVSHSHVVKRIFRYLKGQPKLGLWYPGNSPFDLLAYSDSDYAGASLDRKSTTGGYQFLCTLDSESNARLWARHIEYLMLKSNDLPLSRDNTLGSGEDSMKLMALMEHCIKLSELFWQTASASTLENGDMEITATIDGKVKVLFEASIRRYLKLEDSDGISTLPTTEIFEQLALMRFIQIFLNKQKRLLLPHQRTYIAPSLTQKLFSNIKRASKGYTGVDTLMFQTMLVQGQILQGEGSTIPVESHHTPIVAPSTSQPHHSPTLRDFIRQETEVPQLSSPTQTHVADEAASTGVDDRHGGAATTVSGLEVGHGSGNIHKTPTMPRDSSLLRVHTHGSDEGRMQPNELMELVTKLSDRVVVLENDLKQTKKTYGVAFTKLIKKVKTLEKTIKSSKARRRAQFVVSDDEEEDSFNQGRKIAEIDEDPDISLVQQMIHHDAQTQGRQEYDLEPNFEFTAPKEVYTAEPDISTATVPVSTVGAEVSTAAESLVYIRRSAVRRKDKGKAIVEESEPTHTKTKIQQEQERLGFEDAQRLQQQFDKEERQRIANVHIEADEEWDNIQAQIEADEELAHRLQAQEREGYSEADKEKLLHMGSHILQQLRGYSFDEIKDLFEATVKRVNTFTLMESDDTVPKVVAGSSKRSAEEELGEESSKRQKIGEGSEPAEESKDKESDELSQEQLQQLIIIVPEEGMNVEALQTKYPIIDWENFNIDDLVKLWDLVRERFNSTKPTDDKENALWVELKRLFEPDTDDLLEL